MKKMIFLFVILSAVLYTFTALANKDLGTCITSTAVTKSLHVTRAVDGGFDGVACGTVFFADGGEVTQLRGLCARCTASTFAGLAAPCVVAYQNAYCP